MQYAVPLSFTSFSHCISLCPLSICPISIFTSCLPLTQSPPFHLSSDTFFSHFYLFHLSPFSFEVFHFCFPFLFCSLWFILLGIILPFYITCSFSVAKETVSWNKSISSIGLLNVMNTLHICWYQNIWVMNLQYCTKYTDFNIYSPKELILMKIISTACSLIYTLHYCLFFDWTRERTWRVQLLH